jgi:hypothetical protein
MGDCKEFAADAAVSEVMGCSLSLNAGPEIALKPLESTSRKDTEAVARMSACA